MYVVTFRVEQQLYALDLSSVREITEMSNIVSVPRSGEHVLGALDLRGEIVPVFNLRRYLGLKTTQETNLGLIELLNAREKDHHNWLNELESSVKESREFKLTTDPHRCAFGKWYDSFQTHNRELRRMLVRFDSPHKRIHQLGLRVTELVSAGHRDQALELIENARSKDFMALIELFETTRQHLAGDHDRLGILVQSAERKFVLPVDLTEQARTIEPKDLKDSFILFNEKTIAILLSADKLAQALPVWQQDAPAPHAA